jgi:two-component system response regulator AlgR
MSAVPASPEFAGSRQPLRVLLVDDEELARLRLRSLVAECSDPHCAVVGEAANGSQAMVWLT